MEADLHKICGILLHQKKYVFSKPDQGKTVRNPRNFFNAIRRNNLITISDINITQRTAIRELKPNSAAGQADVPTILLPNFKDDLSIVLYRLWHCPLDAQVVSKCLKKGIITPVFEGGGRGSDKNYRSIALTSRIIKIFDEKKH